MNFILLRCWPVAFFASLALQACAAPSDGETADPELGDNDSVELSYETSADEPPEIAPLLPTDELRNDELEQLLAVPTLPFVPTDAEVENAPSDASPLSDVKANTICLRPEACDLDGDGFAYAGCEDEVCAPYDATDSQHVQWAAAGHCTRDDNNQPVRCCDPERAALTSDNLCGEAFVQSFQTEALECDHVALGFPVLKGSNRYVNIVNLDAIRSHFRQEAVANGTFTLTYETVIPRFYVQHLPAWEAMLADVHPAKREVPNLVDDDCDGYVDETEYYYTSDGYGLDRNQFEIFAYIRNQGVRDHASHIVVRVFALDDLVNNTHLDHLRRGVGGSYPSPAPAVPARTRTFAYDGSSLARLVITSLPNTGRVWAAEVSFLYRDTGGLEPLRCLDESGAPAAEADCDADGNNRNRVASDVYLVATDTYRYDAPFWLPDEHSRLRREITNRAIYEWDRSMRGLIGWQRNYGFDPYQANGERYTGGNYQRHWCSEFVADVYNYADNSLMSGDWTNVGTDRMYTWFDDNSTMLLDAAARDAIADSALHPGTIHGDYLMMGCSDGSASCVGTASGSHSGIIIGYSPYSPNRGRLWKIGGNEEHRIKLRSSFLQGDSPATAGDTYFRGLGLVP